MSKPHPSEEKKKIYFARTYRHLKFNRLGSLLFLLLFILPATILLFLFYDELTQLMCFVAAWVIRTAGGPEIETASGTFIPWLGQVSYLILPTTLPGYGLILGNLGISLILVWLFAAGPQKGRPAAIYLSIMLLVHIMACVFFLFGREWFPYSLADYSDLYIKQQVGIWITFLVLMGLVMGILGRGSIFRRILTVVLLMAYSFLFGLVRYTLFLGILYYFSVLYMPIMFFALGPLFDFLYFVAIYSISTNKMIRKYDSKRKGEWKWA